MTAFGKSAVSFEGAQISAEIRTVNGRYLDVKLRLPRELSSWEPALRKAVESRLHRGRVELTLGLAIESSNQYRLNKALARNYGDIAEQANTLGVEGQLDVNSLLLLPGVLMPAPSGLDGKAFEKALLKGVHEALDEIVAARKAEGAALERDLQERLQTVDDSIAQIEPLVAEVTALQREKLREKVDRLLGESGPPDEPRLAQEVVYYAERADITEELTRLRTHLSRFREVMASAEGSVGRNLDFICQEMNREMNTIVSKTPSPELSSIAVQGKVEIEKIREQVQNVE